MDITIQAPNENTIREIEDIIDIQKANGNFTTRQVAFTLPEEENALWSGGQARSAESGLARRTRLKKGKKRAKWRASPLPDVVSWPSDSDITVLRMKGCAGEPRAAAPLQDSAGDVAPGDGLHRPDGSSMVNLATLVMQSPPASKHSLAHELLLPLTSWEGAGAGRGAPPPPPIDRAPPASPGPNCPADSRKSRLARFLRLYFCPCCTCLYEMEMEATTRDEPSVYLTMSRDLDMAETKEKQNDL